MKAKRYIANVATVVIAVTILWSCTSNPFGDDEISGGNRIISGIVELSDSLNPEGVYVWLESFNVGTRVDEQGNFQISLPPPGSQSSSGGVSGVFNLYFYVANFNLVIKPVVVRNGLFVYSQGAINKDGEFVNPILINRILSIETVMAPDTVQSDTGSVISARVNLQAIKDTVTVFFPLTVGDKLAPLIFKNIDTGETKIIDRFTFGGVELSDFITVKIETRTRLFVRILSPGDLPIGKYEVIPYMFVIHEEVPGELFNTLGDDVKELGSNYLEIPFRREDGQFEVIEKIEEDEE